MVGRWVQWKRGRRSKSLTFSSQSHDAGGAAAVCPREACGERRSRCAAGSTSGAVRLGERRLSILLSSADLYGRCARHANACSTVRHLYGTLLHGCELRDNGVRLERRRLVIFRVRMDLLCPLREEITTVHRTVCT